MAYANLTPNLQDMFAQINDRLRKLESGPNSAAYSASSAQSTADTALANAATAYTAAQASLQPSANTITNASNQITAINASGIEVRTGTSNPRVVLNGNGLAGFNASGGTTFAILSSDGSAHFAGAITGSTITGSTLNINGNFIVDGTGLMTATGVDITGKITSSSGTIGGFTITSTYLSAGGLTLDSAGNISSTNDAYFKRIIVNGATIGSYNFAVAGGGYFSGSLEVVGNLAVDTTSTVTYNSSNYNYALIGLGAGGTTAGRFYKTAATSSRRFKNRIEPFVERDYIGIINKMEPVTFHYNDDIVENPETVAYGLIAEDVLSIGETDDLVHLDKNNIPESIAYDRIPWYVIKAVQQLTDRVEQLEGK